MKSARSRSIGTIFKYSDLRWFFLLPVLTVIIIVMAGPLHAQEFRASIMGRVSDPSGAVIPGATVTAVQHNTGQVYSAKSNSSGIFSIVSIMPGDFTVTISSKGFSKKVYPDVSLYATQKLNLNVTLKVGSSLQVVTVTATPGLLNTTNASSGGVVDQTLVENMPDTGKNVLDMLGFLMGVRQQGYIDYSETLRPDNQPVFSVDGTYSGDTSDFVNGTPAGTMGSFDFVPAEDAVQEVQGVVNGGADYGPADGGDFNEVIKQGTNKFHGDAYEYWSNGKLDSAFYAANLNHIPKGPNNRNTFGGTLGGPIQKGKTFFFASYQGYRQTQPQPIAATVPTPAERNGDFNGTTQTIYDPSTVTCITMTSAGCKTYGRSKFPDNTIPQQDINPIGAAIVGLYPLPNAPGITNNWIAMGGRSWAYNQYIGRVDHDFSQNTRLSAIANVQTGYALTPTNGLPGVANNQNITTYVTNDDILELNQTLSPSLIADIKASFTRVSSLNSSGFAVQDHYKIPGLKGSGIPTTTQVDLAPSVSVGGFDSLIGNTSNGSIKNYWYFSPSLKQLVGRNILHYGFEFMDIQSGAQGVPSNPAGSFSFSGQWTQENPLVGAAGSGSGLADLLLGYPSGGGANWGINQFFSYHHYDLYVQDDYKALKNLTLDLGIRWDVATPPAERHNGMNGGFCYTCVNPYSAQIDYAAYPGLEDPLTGGLTFAGVDAPHAPGTVPLTNVQPRFGIAWAFMPKTVFRAGFGIYYRYGNNGVTSYGFGQGTSYVSTLDGGLTPTNYFVSGVPYPNGVLVPEGSSSGLETNAGNSIAYVSPVGIGEDPWAQHWSAGIQRVLPENILLDVEYHGTHMHPDLAVGQQWDVIPPSEQAACFQNPAVCNHLVPNPFYGVLPKASSLGSSPNLNAWRLTVPYPLFTAITENNDRMGYGVYNALEIQVKRQIRGLEFVANYTYENSMAANSYLNNGTFRDSNLWYGPAGNEQRNYVNGEMVWPLPVGQGGMLFTKAHGLLGSLLSHWQADTVFQFFTGYPLSVPGANLVGGPGCTSYVPADGQTRAHWFNNNEACYKILGPWQARTTPLYIGYLRTPSFFDWNQALQKSFVLPFRENMSMTFRFECQNCTNTPAFGGPDTNVQDVPRFNPLIGMTGFGTLPTGQQNNIRVFFASIKLAF